MRTSAKALGRVGDDRIFGSGEVFAGAGNDFLGAEGGSLHGGPGNDRFAKSRAELPFDPTRLYGDAGNDTFDTTDLVGGKIRGRP